MCVTLSECALNIHEKHLQFPPYIQKFHKISDEFILCLQCTPSELEMVRLGLNVYGTMNLLAISQINTKTFS